MNKSINLMARNKVTVLMLSFTLIVGGISAQAAGILNSDAGGYLVCVNSKTKVITHPGTAKCPKGNRPLVFGAQGATGITGATGFSGKDGRDGIDGKDGKTLWNGVKDPENSWGAPGDMFINSVTKTLFGPKDLTFGWPAGVSMVGPQGERGLIGLTGAMGPQGPGGTGPAGASGATGPAGAAGTNGTNATIAITELFVCDGTDAGTVADEKCKIGMTGPGGGLIFFVDYNDQYAEFNYLEAAPTDGVFNASAAMGVWATAVATCGAAGNASCQSYSIYTETGVALVSIKGLHRGIFGGQAATNAIIAKHSGVALNLFAAGVADSYLAPSFNGVTKSDYYLPTKDELELMQKNLNNAGLGGFVDNGYWSSSEGSVGYAYYPFLSGGDWGTAAKSTTYYVRPVRAF
jgi:hypothetical protein